MQYIFGPAWASVADARGRFVPYRSAAGFSGVVLRFDARLPRHIPEAVSGGFFSDAARNGKGEQFPIRLFVNFKFEI